MDVRSGYPTYLRDLVDIVRGYEDPPGVMNFRSREDRRRRSAGSQDAGRVDARRCPTTATKAAASRASEAANHARHHAGRAADQGLAHRRLCPRRRTPPWTRSRASCPTICTSSGRTTNPRKSDEKVWHFDQNLIEAVVIVVLVALLFMEWRSALLVAVSIPLTVAMTLGICQLLGIDLQQVSIAAMIIALGLLVDDPVVAGDAINREMAARAAARRGRLARPAKTRPGHPLRHGHQLRGLPAAAVGAGQGGRLHLFAAGRGRGLAGEQPDRLDDVHAAVGLLRAARAEGIRGGRRAERLRRASRRAAIAASPAGASTTRRSC